MVTQVRRLLAELSRTWGLELGDVEVRLESRLRSSLGRADFRRRRVSLSPRVLSERGLLREALTHELAHLAAAQLGANGEGPHGPTWRALLVDAGHEPRVRLALKGTRVPKRKTRHFRHECEVCDFVRSARRRMPNWRCAECVQAGLSGVLSITELT